MSCLHHFDADDVAQAMRGEMPAEPRARFDAHLADCAECTKVARALQLVKEVWQRGIARDEAFAGRAREQRLMSAGFLPRIGASRARFALVGVAVGALGMLAWSAHRSHDLPAHDLPSAGVTGAASASVASVSPSGAPPAPNAMSTSAPIASPEPRASSSTAANSARVVVLKGCASCTHVGGAPGAIADGAVFTANDEVRVPKGAVLALSWGIDANALDEASRIDVEGPADVSSPASSKVTLGSGPIVSSLVVNRGVAHAQAGSARELRSKVATTRADHAAWTLEARSDRTHVEVARGTVHIEASGPRHQVADVAPGDAVNVFADGRIEHLRTASAASAPSGGAANAGSAAMSSHGRPSSDALLWQRSEAALERGDRPAAEAALHALLDSGASAGSSGAYRDRAGVRLAQLELARGDRDDARARLGDLIRGRDRAIAADAALLLARSTTNATERAAVWRDYLRTAPPSPYRQQASVEQALALLDAGDREGARAIADTLHSDPNLPEVVRASLARLDARITP